VYEKYVYENVKIKVSKRKLALVLKKNRGFYVFLKAKNSCSKFKKRGINNNRQHLHSPVAT